MSSGWLQVLPTRTTEICASSSASSLPWLRRCSSSSASFIDVEEGRGGSASPPSSVDCRPPTRWPRPPPPALTQTTGRHQTASRTVPLPSKCATLAAAPPTAPRLTPPPPPRGTPWRHRGTPAWRHRPAVPAPAAVNDCSRRRRRRFPSYDVTPGFLFRRTPKDLSYHGLFAPVWAWIEVISRVE